MQIALQKILHPEKSYSDIARIFDCDKQLVHYHLKRAKAIMPQLEAAILTSSEARLLLSQMATQDLSRFMKNGEFDFEAAQAAGIVLTEVQTTRGEKSDTVKVKTESPRQCVMDLARLKGWLDRETGNLTIKVVPPE